MTKKLPWPPLSTTESSPAPDLIPTPFLYKSTSGYPGRTEIAQGLRYEDTKTNLIFKFCPECNGVAEARIGAIIDPQVASGLPPFLLDDPNTLGCFMTHEKEALVKAINVAKFRCPNGHEFRLQAHSKHRGPYDVTI